MTTQEALERFDYDNYVLLGTFVYYTQPPLNKYLCQEVSPPPAQTAQ